MERFCGELELRWVLESAGDAVFADEAESAELERGGLVGPGRFLRSDENLRVDGERRPRSLELSGGGAVESRRVGGGKRPFAGDDSVWKRHGVIFFAKDLGPLVCTLAQ